MEKTSRPSIPHPSGNGKLAIIANSEIREYAKKYKIPLTKNGKQKTYKELGNDVKEYENKNQKRIKGKMLYFY